jgi:hypothetical protein
MKSNKSSVIRDPVKGKKKKPSIMMTVIKEDTGYSAFAEVGNNSVHTDGESFEELKNNIIEAVNLTFEEEGYSYTIDEIKFTFDMESFFEFYKVINAKALSDRIGMNQSLLAQYIKGIKKPSPNQVKRILTGVQQIGRELSEVRFLM